MLTIGIPSKGINESLVRVLRIALSNSAVEKILVGINPGSVSTEIPLNLMNDPRVAITFHSEDLGLYGNFRYLVTSTTTRYFMWLCTDDSPTSEIGKLLNLAASEDYFLVIPSWDWAEYYPDDKSHSSERQPGPQPLLISNKSIAESAIYAEPGWIFGLWNTKYLVSIFPNRNFDWLDVHILQRVLTTKRVGLVVVNDRATIGTWIWANRPPNSVNPKGHSPFRAIAFQIGIAPSLLFLWPPIFRAIYKRFGNLYRQTKVMNANK
jgi:hypothetical protein